MYKLFVVVGMMLAVSEVRGQEPLGIPKQAKEELQRLVGTWDAEDSAKGSRAFKGVYTYEWGPERSGLIYTAKVKIPTSNDQLLQGAVSGVAGWDASKKQIVCCEFAWGWFNVLRYAIKSPGHWEGEMVSSSPSGTITKVKVNFTSIRPDEFVCRGEWEESGKQFSLEFEKQQ